jgi:hypothetical protein
MSNSLETNEIVESLNQERKKIYKKQPSGHYRTENYNRNVKIFASGLSSIDNRME